jgi:hypothetical protein
MPLTTSEDYPTFLKTKTGNNTKSAYRTFRERNMWYDLPVPSKQNRCSSDFHVGQYPGLWERRKKIDVRSFFHSSGVFFCLKTDW